MHKFKKLFSKIVFSALAFSFVLGNSGVSYASAASFTAYESIETSTTETTDTNDTSSIPTFTSDISTRSTSIPSKDTYVDLSVKESVLGFQVKSLTYGNLFTNSCFTGVTSVKVVVGPITIDDNGSTGTDKDITVSLRKHGSSINVGNSVPVSGQTIYFNNLDPSAKYYFEFSKYNDGKIYSFSGSITKN